MLSTFAGPSAVACWHADPRGVKRCGAPPTQGGFNDWQTHEFRTQLHAIDVQGGDWWKCEFDVPNEVYNMRFLFSDGGDCYDKQLSGDDYTLVRTGTLAQWHSE